MSYLNATRKIIAALAMLALFTGVVGTSRAIAEAAGPTLRIAISSQPNTLDITATNKTASVKPAIENIVETLWDIDKDGNLVPGLASWVTSKDGKTLTFTIRKGVKFHSGDPLTAADVLFSHERRKKMTPIYRVRLKTLKSVKVIDDYTIRFTFSEPAAAFLSARGLYIVSKAYHDRVGEEKFKTHPVGTGPYKFVAYSPGQYIDVERFDGYWGKKPQVKRARFLITKDPTTRVSQLRAGEVDMIMHTPWPQVAALKKEGFRTVSVVCNPTAAVRFGFMNPHVPWADVRVRRAIAHAIDADSIAKGLLDGIPKRYAALGPTEPGYDPKLKPYKYDPALSRKLLAEAGYPKGFPIELIVQSTYYGVKQTGEAVQLYLRAVGIDSKVRIMDTAQLQQLLRKAKKGHTAKLVIVGGVQLANYSSPIDALKNFYLSTSAQGPYINKKFDKIVIRAYRELNPAKQAEDIRQAVQFMHDDVAVVPLWNTVSVYTMKSNIHFTPTLKLIHQTPFLKNITVN